MNIRHSGSHYNFKYIEEAIKMITLSIDVAGVARAVKRDEKIATASAFEIGGLCQQRPDPADSYNYSCSSRELPCRVPASEY